MRTQSWRDLIVKAVTENNDDIIQSLAEQLSKCEIANGFLRAKGYGSQGQTIDMTVRLVPDARDWL